MNETTKFLIELLIESIKLSLETSQAIIDDQSKNLKKIHKLTLKSLKLYAHDVDAEIMLHKIKELSS